MLYSQTLKKPSKKSITTFFIKYSARLVLMIHCWLGLNHKYQWVKINGCKLDVSFIPSGILQGGHLSPLLFALFINSIIQIIPNCNMLAFANDLNIFRKIRNDSNCLLLQGELNALVNWFESICLNLNMKKCWSMSSKSCTLISHSYSINNINKD